MYVILFLSDGDYVSYHCASETNTNGFMSVYCMDICLDSPRRNQQGRISNSADHRLEKVSKGHKILHDWAGETKKTGFA